MAGAPAAVTPKRRFGAPRRPSGPCDGAADAERPGAGRRVV